MKARLAALLALLLTAGSLPAQSFNELTLQDCSDRALQQNLNIRNAQPGTQIYARHAQGGHRALPAFLNND